MDDIGLGLYQLERSDHKGRQVPLLVLCGFGKFWDFKNVFIIEQIGANILSLPLSSCVNLGNSLHSSKPHFL